MSGLTRVLPVGPLLLLLASAALQQDQTPERLTPGEAVRRLSEELGTNVFLGAAVSLPEEVEYPGSELKAVDRISHLANQLDADVWRLGRGSYLLERSARFREDFETQSSWGIVSRVSREARLNVVAPSWRHGEMGMEGRGESARELLTRLGGVLGYRFVPEPGFILRVEPKAAGSDADAPALSSDVLQSLGLGDSTRLGGVRVSFEPAERTVGEYTERIAKESGVAIEVKEPLRSSTLALGMHEGPARDALEVLAAATGAVVWDDGQGSLSIRRIPRITMEFHEAETRIVLDLIALNCKLDMEIAGDIAGTVNLEIDDVPWRDLLHALARTGQFRLRVDESGAFAAARR